MTAAAVAALTVYDMVKGLEQRRGRSSASRCSRSDGAADAGAWTPH